MDMRLFGILVFSGLCIFTSSLHHRQYIFIDEPKTWLDAQQYCREKHTDLATINDEEDMDSFNGLVESRASHVFLGLYRSWGWSLSDDDDYKEGEKAFWNWTSGEPLETQHYCGSIGETGEWFANDCSDSFDFSCYDGSITDPSERFILGSGTKDWPSAQSYCREKHTDLARVRNQLENEELQRMVKKNPVWIGLMGTYWAWSDGSESSYTPWRPQNPGSNGLGDCALLEVNSVPLGMIDGVCDEKQPFICYADPMRKLVFRLTLTADSSVDITDPAVIESILKLMEEKLGEKGAAKDVKVSWRKLPEKEINQKQELTEPIEEVCAP